MHPPAVPIDVPVHPHADASRLRRLARLAGSAWFLEAELATLPALVPQGGTCLDVGANRGAYMVALSLLAGPTGRVVAVEPQPGPLRTATALRRALRLRHVELHQLALGDTRGRLGIVVPYRWGLPVYGRAFLADAPDLAAPDLAEFSGARHRSVEVTTLDALAEAQQLERLDFVKCDIEGAELRMLRGGRRTIARHRPALLLEIEERHTRKYGYGADDIVTWLRRRDYRAHRLAGGALRPVDAVEPDVRNYVFLPA